MLKVNYQYKHKLNYYHGVKTRATRTFTHLVMKENYNTIILTAIYLTLFRLKVVSIEDKSHFSQSVLNFILFMKSVKKYVAWQWI